MNAGCKGLSSRGLSLPHLVEALAAEGLQASPATLSRWRSGSHIPPKKARAALQRAFGIEPGAWEVKVDGPSPPTKPKPPAAPPSKPDPDAGATERDLEALEDDGIEAALAAGKVVDSAKVAMALLRRIREFRRQGDAASSSVEKRHYLGLEAQTVRLYASITARAELTSAEILKSRQWQRIHGVLVQVLTEKHPQVLADVVAALEAEIAA
jgi:transcriptional regulator with XRE-family HTH domain